MTMGRETEAQGDLVVGWAELPRSRGHAFNDELHKALLDAWFDVSAENASKPYCAGTKGAPSLPPGRYFRMQMVGYFERLDSERGIERRCADSFSLRDFFRLPTREKVPDHSWLSKKQSRLPHEVHEKVFAFVLKLVAVSPTLGDTLETAKANLSTVGLAPTPDDPCEIIADKGYYSRRF